MEEVLLNNIGGGISAIMAAIGVIFAKRLIAKVDALEDNDKRTDVRIATMEAHFEHLPKASDIKALDVKLNEIQFSSRTLESNTKAIGVLEAHYKKLQQVVRGTQDDLERMSSMISSLRNAAEIRGQNGRKVRN
jgi:hypothetical protein